MARDINHTQINLYDFFFANKLRKTYTNLGISLLLIIVLLIFALRPTILTIGKIRDKIKQYEDVNQKVEVKIEAAQNLSQQLSRSSEDAPDGLEAEILFMNKVFFANPDIKTFYRNINERANKSNIAIKSLNPKYTFNTVNNNPSFVEFDQSASSPSPKYYEMNLNFEAKNLTDLENFLKTLEGFQSYPIFSRMKALTVSNHIEENRIKSGSSSAGSSVRTTETTIINCNVTLVIYLDETRFKAGAVE